jgi:uncharacterized protein YqgC (DUF456 family)
MENSTQTEKSTAKKAGEAALVNVSASAGVVVGVFIGLAVVGTIVDALNRKKTSKTTIEE